MTPRQLNALIKVHHDLNKVEDPKEKNKQTIDNPENLRDTYLRNKGLGINSYGARGMKVPDEPTHFVDELPFMNPLGKPK